MDSATMDDRDDDDYDGPSDEPTDDEGSSGMISSEFSEPHLY